MRLIIQGKPTHLKKSEIRFAAQWAVKELIGKRLSHNINCYMEFKKIKKNYYGSCLPVRYLRTEPKARSFRIEIDSASRRKTQLTTVFHEIAHLKQLAMEELIYNNVDDIHLWRHKQKIDENEYSYYDLPWEIDARKIEKMLARRYADFIKENYISFV